MSGTPGRIGAYAIERELGRGGMGVVYLGTDTRLNRQVAIKVLPAEVARDVTRLARFEREAKLLASLKHPNIGGIFGLEEADGQRFLVLEYLEGESLANRLDRGPLRVGEAIHVCRQIAAALEVAHESGIVHRDLKPSNVMITDDDDVKVLDFGLAKGDGSTTESSSDMSASPTLTVGATAAGVILGTAAYMSPEQARGRSVDRRTDIWSFGCVLYECLTGRRLFDGETVSDAIAKILEREPDWSLLPKDVPDRIRDLLRRCLEKKARERLRDIGDARIELDEVESGKTSGISGLAAGMSLAEHRRKLRVAWGAAGVTVVAAGLALAAAFLRPVATPPVLMRLEATVPQGVFISQESDNIAISPDGTQVVFVAVDSTGATHLFRRGLASMEVARVPGTQDASHPFWSPDSRHIGFFSGAKLRTVAVEGGTVEVIADVTSPRGGSWGEEFIVFAGAQGPIYRVPVNGGTIEAVTQVDSAAGQTAHRFPVFLPDGRRFMYSVLPPRTGLVKIFASDVDRSRPKEIMSTLGCPAYVEPGYLLWQRGARMVAQRFDGRRLEPRGKPFPVGPAPTRATNLGAPPISVSRVGTFAQLPPTQRRSHLEWQDLHGRTLERLGLDPRNYSTFAISPNGRQVVLVINEDDYQSDLWLVDLEHPTPTRLTFGPGSAYGPQWSPAGDRIFYSADRDGPIELYVKSIVDPNSDSLLVRSDAMFKNPLGWSPDGRYVLYSQAGTGTGIDLWTAPVGGWGDGPRPYLAGPFNESGGSISPDGHWLAYYSDESGQFEVYVTTFPEAGPKYRVSTEGGRFPFWRYDGRELFFRSADGWATRVSVEAGERFQAGTPQRVYPLSDNALYHAISPVAPRWLVAVNDAAADLHTLIIVTGWTAASANP